MPEPTTVTPAPVESSEALASLTSAQRGHWRLTGEFPTGHADAPTDTAEAAEADADDSQPDTTAATAEPEPAQEAKAPETPEPKKLGNPRKDREARMFQAIERERAAVARAEAAERKAAELEAKFSTHAPAAPSTQVPPSAPAPAVPTGEPKLEDFLNDIDPYASLAKATAKWEVAEFKRTLEAQAQERNQAERRRQMFNEVVAKYPDFAERLQNPEVGNLYIPAHIWDALDRSPARAEILNFFSERPDEARRLAASDPVEALLELGRVSAGPARAAVPSLAPPPSAPPPPLTLGSRPSQPEDPTVSALEAKDFLRYKHAANRREMAGKR